MSFLNPQAFPCSLFEPQHDKTNKVTVCPTKTPISLGIRPVWSESSLSAWRKLRPLGTHSAHSEDSDQTGRMPRLIWVFAGRTCHFVGFVMRRLILSVHIQPWQNSLLMHQWAEKNIKQKSTIKDKHIFTAWRGHHELNKWKAICDNDQEPIQSNFTTCRRYKAGKEQKHQGWRQVSNNTSGKPREQLFLSRSPPGYL